MSEFLIYNTSGLHLFLKRRDKNVQALKNTKNKHAQSNLINELRSPFYMDTAQPWDFSLPFGQHSCLWWVGGTKYTRQAENIYYVLTSFCFFQFQPEKVDEPQGYLP